MKYKVGDKLIYFGIWESAHGKLCVVEEVSPSNKEKYWLRFFDLLDHKGDPESCSSTCEYCIPECVYNSGLYKALR